MDGDLVAGKKVLLTGLTGAPQYNGKTGVLCALLDNGRWHVQLDEGGMIGVRPECCRSLSKAEIGQNFLMHALSMQPELPTIGQPCSIFSVSGNQWMDGVVQSVDANQVEVAYSVGGQSVSKQMPHGHPHLQLNRPIGGLTNQAGLTNMVGYPCQTTAAGSSSSSRYRVCLEGTKCPNRDADHLAGFAHPFDRDYEELCRTCHVSDPELPSIRALFRWLDADQSGKLSIEEIEEGLHLLQTLTGDTVHVSLQSIDEDGNGAVNFSEFAQWAGPRLKLPLGVELNRRGNSIGGSCCTIMGCPCTQWRERAVRRKAKKKSVIGGLVKMVGRLLHDTKPPKLCECGHKYSAHVSSMMDDDTSEAPFPHYWQHSHTFESGFHGGSRGRGRCKYNELIPTGTEILPYFQQLFDTTYKNTWTRDRKKHQNAPVPKGYRVVYALRNESCVNWLNYNVRRAHLLTDAEESENPIEPIESHGTDVMSNSWQDSPLGAERLDSDCNEFYLFHGCSERVAKSICSTDFKIGLAGKNTGTLYGGGTYFAESITKADEYASSNERGQYAVLLCRCLGGRVLYTDEVEPDPEELTNSCISGPYDCVVGDREKCRGTYKEFVFYDAEDIYPEYIIFYQRL